MDTFELTDALISMAFSDRLAAIRKERGFTQKGLANAAGLSQIQVHRYENGGAQPTLEAIKRLAVTLSVTADKLIFDDDERGPSDDLRLQFEAVSSMSDDEKKIIGSLIDAYIKKHQIESVLAR